NPDLRRQITLRYMVHGVMLPLEELVITNGALEALNLALQCVTRPDDLVAIESPAIYACLQVLERLKLKAVEIPVHPRTGIDLEQLAERMERLPIRACWFMSSLQNPLGASMDEDKKRALYRLLKRHQVPLIEDDVYAELYYGNQPSRPVKSFDDEGLVLHCSSFSKCLAPGYRVGWVAAGRYAERITKLRLMTTLSPSVPAQAAIADYLQHGGYDRHLRRLRHALETQQGAMLAAAARHFPGGHAGDPARRWLLPVVRVPRADRFAPAVPAGAGPGHQPGTGADLLGQPGVWPLCAAQPWPPVDRQPRAGHGGAGAHPPLAVSRARPRVPPPADRRCASPRGWPLPCGPGGSARLPGPGGRRRRAPPGPRRARRCAAPRSAGRRPRAPGGPRRRTTGRSGIR